MRLVTYVPLLTIAVTLAMGCASRSVPERFPRTSAASPSAREPRPEPVARALAEDPPLPGENTERWRGLRPAGDSPDGTHMHHHGAHGQRAPDDAPNAPPPAGASEP